jgi:hypothetical protein
MFHIENVSKYQFLSDQTSIELLSNFNRTVIQLLSNLFLVGINKQYFLHILFAHFCGSFSKKL